MTKIIPIFLIAAITWLSAANSKAVSGSDSPPELHGAEVRKKIDARLAEIKTKIEELEKSQADSPTIDELKSLQIETQQLSSLFDASHQFLEAEKFIISQQIDRIGTSVEHALATAKVQEAMKGLSGTGSKK